MDGLDDFAMVTSPNGTGVVVIGGRYTKFYRKRLRNGKGTDSYERTTHSNAIFELDGRTMKWIRLDQNLKFGRKNHSAIQIPSNLTIQLDETANVDNDIEKKVKNLADVYYLEKDESELGSKEDAFPHSKNCATFIHEKLGVSVAEINRILNDNENYENDASSDDTCEDMTDVDDGSEISNNDNDENNVSDQDFMDDLDKEDAENDNNEKATNKDLNGKVDETD